MKESMINIWHHFLYGFLKRTPNIDFSEIPQKLDIVSHYDKKNKVHWVEVPQLPEFYATGKTSEELARNIYDTILVYFDVPTYFAKRFKPSESKLNFLNKKTGKEEIIQLDYKEELDKVLA